MRISQIEPLLASVTNVGVDLGNPLTQLLAGIVLSVPVGVLSGIYSGLIVARMARFEELRNEMRRLIHLIDYGEEQGRFRFLSGQETLRTIPARASSIVSDLLHLGHEGAGEVVAGINQEIGHAFATTPHLRVEEFDQTYLDWQQRCRAMKPNKRVILNPITRL